MTITSSSEPDVGRSTPEDASVAPPDPQAELDVALMPIFEIVVPRGDMHADMQKRVKLFGILCWLTVEESAALFTRFSNPTLADELSTRFRRTDIVLRMHILNYLADAPWRASREKKPPKEPKPSRRR